MCFIVFLYIFLQKLGKQAGYHSFNIILTDNHP